MGFFKLPFIMPNQRVISLPMRNWNSPIIRYNLLDYIKLLVYLWGIETNSHPHSPLSWTPLLVYLWGIETKWSVGAEKQICNVISLPMRNWNKNMDSWDRMLYYVISLPMRNWNYSRVHRGRQVFFQLLVYLWGIETVVLFIE